MSHSLAWAATAGRLITGRTTPRTPAAIGISRTTAISAAEIRPAGRLCRQSKRPPITTPASSDHSHQRLCLGRQIGQRRRTVCERQSRGSGSQLPSDSLQAGGARQGSAFFTHTQHQRRLCVPGRVRQLGQYQLSLRPDRSQSAHLVFAWTTSPTCGHTRTPRFTPSQRPTPRWSRKPSITPGLLRT